jgi:hypothetical protein
MAAHEEQQDRILSKARSNIAQRDKKLSEASVAIHLYKKVRMPCCDAMKTDIARIPRTDGSGGSVGIRLMLKNQIAMKSSRAFRKLMRRADHFILFPPYVLNYKV